MMEEVVGRAHAKAGNLEVYASSISESSRNQGGSMPPLHALEFLLGELGINTTAYIVFLV